MGSRPREEGVAGGCRCGWDTPVGGLRYACPLYGRACVADALLAGTGRSPLTLGTEAPHKGLARMRPCTHPRILGPETGPRARCTDAQVPDAVRAEATDRAASSPSVKNAQVAPVPHSTDAIAPP